MKKLILIAISLFIGNQAWATPAYARTCVPPYNCTGAEWGCEKIYQSFTSRPDFQTWLNSNPGIEFVVAYSTSTRIDIIWNENCYSRPVDCTDMTGVCDAP